MLFTKNGECWEYIKCNIELIFHVISLEIKLWAKTNTDEKSWTNVNVVVELLSYKDFH